MVTSQPLFSRNKVVRRYYYKLLLTEQFILRNYYVINCVNQKGCPI